MTTDYPSWYLPSRREREYNRWREDLYREAQRRGLDFKCEGSHVEFLDEDGYPVEYHDFESRLDHPARTRT